MRRVPGLLWAALSYTLLLEAMLVAAVLLWPEFAENLAAFGSMTRALPIAKEMLAEIEDKGFLAYVIGQHFFKGANALGVAAAALFAAPMIAGEAHRGTLELLLARPFSRRRILLERWLAGALATIMPVFLTTLTLPWLAWPSGVPAAVPFYFQVWVADVSGPSGATASNGLRGTTP